MSKKHNNATTRAEFRGVFGVDGVSGGDTYPYWEVDVETYKKVMYSLHDTKDPLVNTLPNGKVQLFLNQLVDYGKEGTKQKVRIVIED